MDFISDQYHHIVMLPQSVSKGVLFIHKYNGEKKLDSVLRKEYNSGLKKEKKSKHLESSSSSEANNSLCFCLVFPPVILLSLLENFFVPSPFSISQLQQGGCL